MTSRDDQHLAAGLDAAMGVTPQVARRYLRATISLPDGRLIVGGQPGTSGATLLEHELRDRLAGQLGGITEAVLPYGRADVLTASAVFEVEPYRSWRHGVRQALAYSAQTGLPPAVALFGAVTEEGILNVFGKLVGRFGSSPVRVPVALWWWDRTRWEAVTGTGKCRAVARNLARARKPDPSGKGDSE